MDSFAQINVGTLKQQMADELLAGECYMVLMKPPCCSIVGIRTRPDGREFIGVEIVSSESEASEVLGRLEMDLERCNLVLIVTTDEKLSSTLQGDLQRFPIELRERLSVRTV